MVMNLTAGKLIAKTPFSTLSLDTKKLIVEALGGNKN
jgi:hypothetical protein